MVASNFAWIQVAWIATVIGVTGVLSFSSSLAISVGPYGCYNNKYSVSSALSAATASASATATAKVSTEADKHNNVGLYIHIPYCRQRCRYCDFAIVPIGDHNNTNEDDQLRRREKGFLRMDNRYVSAVVEELKQIAADKSNKNNCNNNQKIPLKSIYFGGGTPSLAPIDSIKRILYHVCGLDNPDAPFCLLQHDDTTEISMEMDPGTFDLDQLLALRTLGINRISLGVQSFDDDLLQGMGRTHRRADVFQAISDIASVFGGDGDNDNKVNYSIDLISGVPGLTLAKWAETLEEATAGIDNSSMMTKKQPLLLSSLPPPSHISVYDMQIEEGTLFGKWATEAKAAAAKSGKHDDDDHNDMDEDESRKEECAFMYKYAAGYLRAKNYEHYEVSSYAAFHDNKDDDDDDIIRKKNSNKKSPLGSISKRSRHNQIYWDYDGQWYAVGLGATSFVESKLVARPRQMNDYIEWVMRENNDTKASNVNNEDETDDSFLSDIILKRLRTIDGLDLTWLETKFGMEAVVAVIDGAKLGLELGIAERTTDNILRLKDPEG
ncbi:coproporphyrinogen III oxidase [Fragilariopsis cylindrus CCMP1102]|uniref:Coproporphyrinogen III oxidase n=1 Tax=Fragilariopsis cylindrus CCMP1102 TaxID=635003 RepID=A0A1E7F7M6_9STRA|nr:coproporphyrinogen III oxidase [Fragilariopsis cylindrus CCMP1102]|eukprot:OEU14156.1 coproporphyrinogen III oxidase [Fragilariopsis cylindrus CCMP1102]